MKKYLTKNERGFTLIEIIASLVLISIILLSFINVFVQTTKTRVASEQIVTATYIAQQEMEKFYAYSKKHTFDLNAIDQYFDEYEIVNNHLVQVIEDGRYNISIQFNNSHNKLYTIIIEVAELQNNGEYLLKSKMENIYIWGG